MLLAENRLAKSQGQAAGKNGIKKMQPYPTILMKTKENESDKWAYPTMLMKTNAVSFSGHDVYENKWG